MISITSPAVSIVTAAYNVSQYIAETLDSVLAQTFSDYEIVVVNDGSPDTVRLEEVIQPYRDRIVYLKQENQGVSGARNAGIRAARGEYIAFLDGDDLWEPTFLEKQVGEFRRRPDLDLRYADTTMFGDTALNGRSFLSLCPSERPVDLDALLAQRATVITSTTVARRQALLDAGLFDEGLRHVEDFDLWCRMAAAGKQLDFTPERFGRRRVAAGLSSNAVAMTACRIAVYNKNRSLPGISAQHIAIIDSKVKESEAELELRLGKQHLAAREYAAALRHLRTANRYFRRPKLSALIAVLSVAPRVASLLSQHRLPHR
jgi:glycosyltransferase involved in cell wall biosynthesis